MSRPSTQKCIKATATSVAAINQLAIKHIMDNELSILNDYSETVQYIKDVATVSVIPIK